MNSYKSHNTNKIYLHFSKTHSRDQTPSRGCPITCMHCDSTALQSLLRLTVQP